MDRHEALELMADLLDHLRRSRSDDGDARQVRFVRHLGDREALDIEAARRK